MASCAWKNQLFQQLLSHTAALQLLVGEQSPSSRGSHPRFQSIQRRERWNLYPWATDPLAIGTFSDLVWISSTEKQELSHSLWSFEGGLPFSQGQFCENFWPGTSLTFTSSFSLSNGWNSRNEKDGGAPGQQGTPARPTSIKILFLNVRVGSGHSLPLVRPSWTPNRWCRKWTFGCFERDLLPKRPFSGLAANQIARTAQNEELIN